MATMARRAAIASIMLAIALPLGACGAGSGTATSASPAAATSASPAAADSPAVTAAAGTPATAESPAGVGGKAYTIGFSNSFNGNTYRQSMEAYAKEAADALIKTGEVKQLIFAEANQDNNKQIQQIQSFIVQGVDAIIVDPGSATALTGVVQAASDAGIPVITVNDGPIQSNAEKVYQIYFDAADQMKTLTDYIAKAMGGKGTMIELRGTQGDAFDAKAHEGVVAALTAYPDIKVVAQIYTDWTGSKAQTELAGVLPNLLQQYGKIDGVVTQGGDSYAAVQAFQQAGAALPIIGGDNRGFFLKWWANVAPKGYDTLSVSANPWDGASAVYAAVDVLSGKYAVPKMMVHPIGIITKDQVQNYKNVADEAIAAPTYDRAWVRDNLYKQP
jgi:ribose transport system substrate-binding protein